MVCQRQPWHTQACSSTTSDTRTTSRDRHRMPITRRWSRAPKSPWKSRPRDAIRGQALRFPANQKPRRASRGQALRLPATHSGALTCESEDHSAAIAVSSLATRFHVTILKRPKVPLRAGRKSPRPIERPAMSISSRILASGT